MAQNARVGGAAGAESPRPPSTAAPHAGEGADLSGGGESMASEESIKTAASDLPSFPPASPGSRASMSAAVWGLEIGSVFPSADHPKYHISDEIDDGGMGIVYEAHQGELGVVAIKVIKPNILGQAASERFLNEARAMGKVRSEPGIATIFDCDWYTDGATGTRAPYIVMEYVPGAEAITTYADDRKLTMRERLLLFQKVCEAVAAAHRAEIIHRDLKPANVLISGTGQPKVIDFGLAVVRDPTEHAKRMPSERGGLFGTLEYMSPEQASKRFDPHVLTAASDVYSLGVILYELLLGRLPYEKHPGKAVRRFEDGPPDYTEATRIIREDAPIEPHRVNRGVHPGVEGILLKALEKEPGRRYANAGEMAAAIGRHLRGALRRDVLRSAPVVVAALVLAHVVGIPALFNWTGVNDGYQRLAAMVAPSVDRFEHVVLVTGDEETDLSLFELDKGTPREKLGMGAGERGRPLWGAVCEKLAESECRVVALDLLFDVDATLVAKDDDDLIAGLEALKRKGIECVLASPEWEDRLTLRSRVMSLPGVKLGAVWLHPAPTSWIVEIGIGRHHTVFPSFSLQAAGAWRHPGEDLIFDLVDGSYEVRVLHSAMGASRWQVDPEPIFLSRCVYGDHHDVAQLPVDSVDIYTNNDALALLHLNRLPASETFDRVKIDAGDLLKLSSADLKRLCHDKVVVLAGRHRTYVEEFATTPDGRLLPKSYGHMLAIETMLQKTPTIRSIGARFEILATLVFAVLGVGIASALPGRFLAGSFVAVGTAGAVAAGSLLVLNQTGTLINPVVPMAALALSAAGAAGLPELGRRTSALIGATKG